MRNHQIIYLTAMLAASAAAAVAAILAAAPTASPANVQLSFTAAIQNAPLDPCELDPYCDIPGLPGNVNSEIPGIVDPSPVPANVNNPEALPDDSA